MDRSAASRHLLAIACLAGALVLAGCTPPWISRTPPAPTPVPVPVSKPAPPPPAPAPVPPPDPTPPSFVHSTSDTRSTQIIELRDGLTRAAAFRIAADALDQNFTVDVSDPRAGFLMTTWQASVVHDGVPDVRYRTRIVVRFPMDDPKEFTVRADANWQRGEEWDVGFDSALLAQVTSDLRAKIGKRP